MQIQYKPGTSQATSMMFKRAKGQDSPIQLNYQQKYKQAINVYLEDYSSPAKLCKTSPRICFYRACYNAAPLTQLPKLSRSTPKPSFGITRLATLVSYLSHLNLKLTDLKYYTIKSISSHKSHGESKCSKSISSLFLYYLS